MSLTGIETTKVGGINTACLGRRSLAKLIGSKCHVNLQAGTITTPILVFSNNALAISLANRDKHTMSLLSEAEMVHADG